MGVPQPVAFFYWVVSGLGAWLRARLSRRKPDEQRTQCSEYRRLLYQFAVSMQALISLKYEQFSAALSGGVDLTATTDLLEEAERRKEKHKRALLAHVRQHGCSEHNQVFGIGSGTQP